MLYDRSLRWKEPPTDEELRYSGWDVVRVDRQRGADWLPLAQIGEVSLCLAPSDGGDAPVVRYRLPAIAAKEGRTAGVGVDGIVVTEALHPAVAARKVSIPSLPGADPARFGVGHKLSAAESARRIAVIDVSFDNHQLLEEQLPGDPSVDGPFLVGLPTDVDGVAPMPLGQSPGHGTAMAAVLLNAITDARVGLFQIPAIGGAAPPYLAATSLAMAVASAVEGWQAGIVLIAMSDGAWGTPEPLRDVLREAVRVGRGGLGAAIFCSVGDPSRNHPRDDDSAALAADDLASQPWVTAVAACDERGRWYRTYPAHREGRPATYNRFGPSVTLCAPGVPRRHGLSIAADDSSQAAALVAAAAATVLSRNDGLSVYQLRDLLTMTADVVVDVDVTTGGAALAAGFADSRDRLGHNLKIGHGTLNAPAAALAAGDPVVWALLATRPVPDPWPGDADPTAVMTTCWEQAIGDACLTNLELARSYHRARAGLTTLALVDRPFQESVLWLARHVRALLDSDADGGSLWFGDGQTHGALLLRLRHVADVVHQAITLRGGEDNRVIRAWNDGFTAWMREIHPDVIANFLSTTFAPVRKLRGKGGPSRRRPRRTGDDAQRGPT